MSDGVMVALLPVTTDWSKLEVPHCTLVYAGKVEDHNETEFNKLAKDVAALAQITRPITLETTKLAIFGDGSDDNPLVDVFLLRKTPELMALRRFLEGWNASTFDFNPHVTLGPRGSFDTIKPPLIRFNQICVGWGDEYLTFNFKGVI